MEPFRFHLFVCTQEKPEGVPSCPAKGSWQVLGALHRELHAQGLSDDVHVTTSGCLGLCDHGPVMIAYPDGAWYREVQVEDVPEIVASHLKSGKAVARKLWTDAGAIKAEILDHVAHYLAMVKARDEAGVLPDDLNETIRGFMSSRAVLTALELDVFTAVGAGASIQEVAGRINANERATEMLLNALASLKLLEKTNGTFHNTAASARFFVEGSRDSARAGLIHMANLWHRWSTLTECVREGTAVQTRGRDASSTQAFIAAMDRNARERARAVVEAVGCEGIRRLLDLGGGSGAYSIAFARAIPGLRAEVLDVPEVLPLTQEYIRKAGLADRVHTRPGDMLHDHLGEGYDVILLSAICHMFSPEENRGLFQRAGAALARGGKLVVQDFILEPDKTAPRFAALFALNMLVGTRAGSSYSEPEYADWLGQAGFGEIRRVRLPGPSGLMIATRAV
ncbi:MAG TPA: methyltransferase [Terriglobales bacterium]|jgi:(2Fe-2S) ferredoxin/predicted O-methyltransferase YrrM|nr:methyltransferase [Terriglobales bacterium]